MHGLGRACQGFNLRFCQSERFRGAVTTGIAHRDRSIGVQTIERLEFDGGIHQHIIGVLVAAAVQPAFKHHQVFGVLIGCGCNVFARNDHGDTIVGALDGDGQCGGGGVSVRILDGVGIGFCERLVIDQTLYCKIAVVQGVAIPAIGMNHKTAVFTVESLTYLASDIA